MKNRLTQIFFGFVAVVLAVTTYVYLTPNLQTKEIVEDNQKNYRQHHKIAAIMAEQTRIRVREAIMAMAQARGIPEPNFDEIILRALNGQNE